MFLFQTTELMNSIRHPRPVQNINKQVPVFQAVPYVFRKRGPTTEISPHTFEVPIKGSDTHCEADERKGRKQPIRRNAHCNFSLIDKNWANTNEDGTREVDFLRA
jgi:hypothetical protein